MSGLGKSGFEKESLGSDKMTGVSQPREKLGAKVSQADGQQVQRPWKWEEGESLSLHCREERRCKWMAGGHGVQRMGKKPMELVLVPSDSQVTGLANSRE